MEIGYRKSLNIRFHLDPRTKLLLLILFSVVVMIDVTDGPGLYCPGHHDLHSCGSGLPGRETPCRRKVYCSFHFGYMAYGDYTGKNIGGIAGILILFLCYMITQFAPTMIMVWYCHFNNKNQ